MAMKECYYCFDPSEFKDLLLGFSEQVDKKNYYKLDAGADASNPFGNLGLMMMLNEGNSMNDLLPLMLMMNANKPAAPAHECKCGGHCGEHHTQG